MIYISSEDELQSLKYDKIYFYSSYIKNDFISDLILSKINNDNTIIGIDLYYFDTYIKRYKIAEIPTVLFFKDGKEIDRVSGLKCLDILLINKESNYE